MLQFKMTGQTLTRLDKIMVVAYAQNYVECFFEFEESVAEHSKMAYFKLNYMDTVAVEIIDGKCYMPNECIRNGVVRLNLELTSGLQRITSSIAKIQVTETGETSGDEPLPPTPSVFDKFYKDFDIKYVDNNLVLTMKSASGSTPKSVEIISGNEPVTYTADDITLELSAENEFKIKDTYTQEIDTKISEAVGAIIIPTKTSELTNDSSYITSDDIANLTTTEEVNEAIQGAVGSLVIPTKTSDLINDSNYITNDDIADFITEEEVDEKLSSYATAEEVNTAVADLVSNSELSAALNPYVTDGEVDNKVDSKVAEEVAKIAIPTKTSELTNDSEFITANALEPYATKTEAASIAASEVAKIVVPTKTSELTNDSGFVTNANLEQYDTSEEVNTKIATATSAIKVPKRTSELINDSGFVDTDVLSFYAQKTYVDDALKNYDTSSQVSTKISEEVAKIAVPTKTSELINDSEFVTSSDIEGLQTQLTDTQLANIDDVQNKVAKVEGKSLISDTEITRLASVTNYNDTAVQNHMSNSEIHVSSEEKNNWNSNTQVTIRDWHDL